MMQASLESSALARHNWPAAQGVFDSTWIILVEGRADVVNLFRAGYDNAIAIEGARIDESVTKLTEGKRVIAFLDGDRAEPNTEGASWRREDR